MAPFGNYPHFGENEASEESDVDSSDSGSDSDDEAMKQWEMDQIKRGVRYASKGGSDNEARMMKQWKMDQIDQIKPNVSHASEEGTEYQLAKTGRMLEEKEAAFNALQFDYPRLQEGVKKLEEMHAYAIRLMKDPEGNAEELESIEAEVRAMMSERRGDATLSQDDVINID